MDAAKSIGECVQYRDWVFKQPSAFKRFLSIVMEGKLVKQALTRFGIFFA